MFEFVLQRAETGVKFYPFQAASWEAAAAIAKLKDWTVETTHIEDGKNVLVVS